MRIKIWRVENNQIEKSNGVLGTFMSGLTKILNWIKILKWCTGKWPNAINAVDTNVVLFVGGSWKKNILKKTPPKTCSAQNNIIEYRAEKTLAEIKMST